MDPAIASALQTKKAAVVAGNTAAEGKADQLIQKLRKAAYAKASTPREVAQVESNEEETHPEGCKCTQCCDHPDDCKCGCQDREEANETEHDEDCPCQQCEFERAVTHHDMTHESTHIINFIKALSQKNYASANKYLQGVVESKLKSSISKAANK